MNPRILHLLAVVMTILAACGPSDRSSSDSAGATVENTCENRPAVNDMTAHALSMADSVLAGMSLEERVGQCFMPAIYANADPATVTALRRYVSDLHVGGVVLLKGDLGSAALMSGIGGEASVPLFMAIDAEWGLGMRLEDAPRFPRNGNIGPRADEELLYDYGREVARECRRVGINMVLGPVVDVAENPDGVIGKRSFGSDPVRVADLGVAYGKGVESGAVISVAKHFPGHGSPADDSHRTLPVIRRTAEQLDSIDLYPFRRYIDEGLSGVMVGHLSLPAIDPEGLPAAVSPAVMGDLLRGKLGFKGLVLTDALNMGGVSGYHASDALAAGADIVVGPSDTAGEIAMILKLIHRGDLDVSVIDSRCRRILFYKFLIGAGVNDPVEIEGLREEVRGESDSLRVRLMS